MKRETYKKHAKKNRNNVKNLTKNYYANFDQKEI